MRLLFSKSERKDGISPPDRCDPPQIIGFGPDYPFPNKLTGIRSKTFVSRPAGEIAINMSRIAPIVRLWRNTLRYYSLQP